MSTVAEITLRAIYDSRGQPTVEATVATEEGAIGRVGAPSGASTGRHEVVALPPGGVEEALTTFRSRLRPALLGRSTTDQPGWDAELHRLDGTDRFAQIGGNVATALSLAVSLARSTEEEIAPWRLWKRPGVDGQRRPAIVGNCLNGGRHAIGGPEFQEFHAVSPDPRPAAAIRAAIDVHHRIGRALRTRFPRAAIGRGDEGGWVVPLSNLEALEILAAACTETRDELGIEVHPGLDLAASEFYADGRYRYRDQTLDPDGQIRFLAELVDRFDLRYIEDPLQEEDFEGFARFTAEVGRRALVVGDDLYTTNPGRIDRGIRARSSNAALIKVNQIGTLTDTFEAIDRARGAGWDTVTSHRSGDVPEGWLAHLALASGAAGLKCGLLGGERVAKLNELLRVAAPAEE